jgi:glyoxylase-like metal-dependent hydrolase (beta-lactamase superfamily II)/rhodanese-related sulfurtransferase
MTDLTASDLYRRLADPSPPRILDVRNGEEFAHWRVEGPAPVEMLNVPYFEFIEQEEASIRKVADWLAGRPGDLVVVCAQGGSSAYVADLLRARGLGAANLAGGMGAWGLGTAIRPVPAGGAVRLWQVLRFGRGCLSYIVAGGEDAVVVDPHRGLDTYRALLDRERLRLRAVFDTHLHADHVSGGPALARDGGVGYHASPRDFEDATVPVEAVVPGRPVRIGRLEVLPLVPLATPGHTPGSTSLLVGDALLLTGDTLFVDDVGRPDLGGQAATWARDLHRTLHERLQPLRDAVVVLPAHAHSLAPSGPGGTIAGTLGALRQGTRALQLDLEAFVQEAERAAGSAPAEYAKIRAINLGRQATTEGELAELELGKNQCALSRR